MDGTWIGIAIGAGSLFTAIIAIIIQSIYSEKHREIETEKLALDKNAADEERILKAFEPVCLKNQGKMLEQVRKGEQHIHKRMDAVAEDVAFIRGELKNLSNSMNGGLESRIARAVKSAIEG